MGATIFNLAGGVVIVGLCLVAWLYSFRSRRQRVASELSAVRANVRMWEEALRSEKEQPEVFSESEELSGEPDRQRATNVVEMSGNRRSRRR